jgi:hypothetical protein
MAKKLIIFLVALALVAAIASTKRVGALAAARDDDDLPQRQDAMSDAVKVFSGYNPDTTDPRVLKRAVATVNGAMAPLRPIFKAISRMPESTAAEVRAKEEARAAANELLTRHLGELLPGGSVKITNEL